MTDQPFSRTVSLSDVSPSGTHVTISADAGERKALAEMLRLPEVKRLEGRFEIRPFGRDGLSVRGEVDADVVQVCGVTLEPFDAHVSEAVDVRFAADEPDDRDLVPGAEHEADLEAPDVLVNGRADLGTLATEHLALGLDPYPRKPNADLPAEAAPEPESEPGTHRPFAGLEALMKKGGKPAT